MALDPSAIDGRTNREQSQLEMRVDRPARRRPSVDRDGELDRLPVNLADRASEAFHEPLQPHDVLIANNLAGDSELFRTVRFGLRAKEIDQLRSEERRVGKECRSRWS